ncbi:tyrosine-type recombinase/integrase [Rothia nasisuis]|uniref:tyrosine-type recombinase/integrase n=1 Tax=Rothia nasisuis TaxID=2109647 RepID=UPI001F163AC5|nr:tyrosine-type recombinase/integrase [Rothia nasisuis]
MHPSWKLHLTGYTTWLTAAGRTPRTISTRTYWINRIAHDYPTQPPEELTVSQLATWLANPSWSPVTKKSALASVRGLYRYLKTTGAITQAPTDQLLSIAVPRKLHPPAPYDVFVQAVQKAENQEIRLILLLAGLAGLRRTEIASLHTSAFHSTYLSITGKGGHVRIIPAHPDLQALLSLKTHGYYFPGRFSGHRTHDYVGRKISAALGKGYTPHSLRRLFATEVYRRTKDIKVVQKLLGHADISTTQQYVGYFEQDLWDAVAALPSLNKTP